jgi:triosephosphate isomerase
MDLRRLPAEVTDARPLLAAEEDTLGVHVEVQVPLTLREILDLRDRDDTGRELDVIGAQLAGSVPDTTNGADTAIACEPVWATGSGRTPTEGQIAAVHRFLRDALEARFGEGGCDRS